MQFVAVSLYLCISIYIGNTNYTYVMSNNENVNFKKQISADKSKKDLDNMYVSYE